MSTIEDELLVPETNAAVVESVPRSDADRLSFIDRYLAEQQALSVVDRFSQFHNDVAESPLQSRYYSALLPATPPREGEQYAFEVDLDLCSGCKACVTACHSLNGLDPGEIWRNVGMLHGGTSEVPVMQHVTAACHHCIDPACLSACPVMAYEKDRADGNRPAFGRSVHRLPVLHFRLSLRRAEIQQETRDHSQVRHVQQSAGRRQGAGLRAGLSASGDSNHDCRLGKT